MQLVKSLIIFPQVIFVSSLLIGCASAPRGEGEVLSGVRQLTDGFSRAGEAYFSPRMRWIIFQATPPGETDYQMYVAALSGDKIDAPVRITPMGSKNTCGFFSPDENAIIFASTAGHPAAATEPAAPAAGDPRSTGTHQWELP